MAPERKTFSPPAGGDKVSDMAADIRADGTILDEAALLTLREDLGSRDLQAILTRLKQALSLHADKFAQAVVQGDMLLVGKTAHDIVGMGLQFGAPSLAALAKVAELHPRSVDEVSATNLVSAIEAVNAAIDAFDAKYLKNQTD